MTKEHYLPDMRAALVLIGEGLEQAAARTDRALGRAADLEEELAETRADLLPRLRGLEAQLEEQRQLVAFERQGRAQERTAKNEALQRALLAEAALAKELGRVVIDPFPPTREGLEAQGYDAYSAGIISQGWPCIARELTRLQAIIAEQRARPMR